MPLKTERNTPAMGKRVLDAFIAKFDYDEEDMDHHCPRAYFEHGQWWITTIHGAIYSVVDAEGPGTVDGFGFENIAALEEAIELCRLYQIAVKDAKEYAEQQQAVPVAV